MFVTIAIPFYNAEKYLADAIRSVFAQTHQDWELLLIDDGSTDKSLSIANSVRDPRVRVFSDGKNKKLAGRLNEVTDLARYDYIARMDADDLMLPNRIEKQLAILLNSDVDIVTSGVFSVLNDLSLVGIRGTAYKEVYFDDVLSRKVGITHAALVARRSWYKRNKYDENLTIAQDLDLWLRTSKKKDLKIISLKDPLYIYREEDNVTEKKMLRAYQNERNMIRKYGDSSFSKLILKSYLKTAVVRILGVFNKVDILQKKRGQHDIAPEDQFSYYQAIEIIKSTKVNGLDV
jgi:glycosyltransferase involved in cell wall biosynthesis